MAFKSNIRRSGMLLFGQQVNLEDMIKAVGDKNVVQRGSELIFKLEELKQLNEKKVDN